MGVYASIVVAVPEGVKDQVAAGLELTIESEHSHNGTCYLSLDYTNLRTIDMIAEYLLGQKIAGEIEVFDCSDNTVGNFTLFVQEWDGVWGMHEITELGMLEIQVLQEVLQKLQQEAGPELLGHWIGARIAQLSRPAVADELLKPSGEQAGR